MPKIRPSAITNALHQRIGDDRYTAFRSEHGTVKAAVTSLRLHNPVLYDLLHEAVTTPQPEEATPPQQQG